jgi:hypothetical protein
VYLIYKANRFVYINYVLAEKIEAKVYANHDKIFSSDLQISKLYLYLYLQIKEATRMIAKKFEISGPFNTQFLAKDGKVMVS